MIVIDEIALCIGLILTAIGAICDLLASIGLNKFPNFYVRMHAATIGVIGGAVIPLIGIGLIALVSDQFGAYRFMVFGISILTALLIMIASPTGTHILAYAAHKAKLAPVHPRVVDKLEEAEEK